MGDGAERSEEQGKLVAVRQPVVPEAVIAIAEHDDRRRPGDTHFLLAPPVPPVGKISSEIFGEAAAISSSSARSAREYVLSMSDV